MARPKRGMAAGFVNRQAERVRESDDRAGALIEDMGRMKDELRREGGDLERRRAQLQELLGVAGEEPTIELDRLELMGEAQSRVHIDPSVVEEYVDRMSWDAELARAVDPEGAPWPAVTVYTQGDELWVADGFHRVEAARKLGFDRIQCRVLEGGRRDAIRYSLSANARHGLRRTREDKRRAVRRALEDDMWRTWTDTRLAELCSVSRSLVSSSRERLESDGSIPGEVALYSVDGREFERTPSSTPMKARKKPAARSARARLEPLADAAPVRAEVDWDALEPGGARALVAYPREASHYEALVACAAASELELIVCPLMSGTRWMWQGPALLNPLIGLGFSEPRVVEVGSWGKRFTVWTRSRAGIDERVVSYDALLGVGNVRVVGRSLDPWLDQA